MPFIFFLAFASAALTFAQDVDPLSKLNVRATEGAAAGYVPDTACQACHPVHYQGYQDVGMAQSFSKPETSRRMERFGELFKHQASGRNYQIFERDGQLIFRRYLLDQNDQPIHNIEIPIDWILGSGNRARSYLFQNPSGELYQLPLGWYSEDQKWDMSPGFESADHKGLMRQVQRECMFCHNAYPEVPEGSDAFGKPHHFPKHLPQGTGCQRCHGPGADHIRAALTTQPLEVIHKRIVNPAKLEARKRDSVCFQCHMLPSITLIGNRRFDRPVYSFRPGQDLSEYMLHVTLDDEKGPTDQFEINHHGFRFWQSRCFQESQGALACISCHDPHVKPKSADFRSKVASVCLSCHPSQASDHKPHLDSATNCVTCHMPTTRTADVIQVTMTDHRIARGPFDLKALIAPVEKTEPIVTDIHLLKWGNVPQEPEASIYRSLSVIKALTKPNHVSFLKNQLLSSHFKELPPYYELMIANLRLGNFQEARSIGHWLMKNGGEPESFTYSFLGTAYLGLGQMPEAAKALAQSVKIQPTPDAYYHLALIAYKSHQDDLAMTLLEKALQMRPFHPMALYYKAKLYRAKGHYSKAIKTLEQALSVEPSLTVGTYDLVQLLQKTGQKSEAERYLELGLKIVGDPDKLTPLKLTPQ